MSTLQRILWTRDKNQQIPPIVIAFLLLLASCGGLPTTPPLEPTPPLVVEENPTAPPTEVVYPPPPTPEPSPTPAPTPAPTVLPVPVLEVQPVPEQVRQGERIAFLRDGDLWLVRPDGSALAQVSKSGNVTALYGWDYSCTQLLLGVGERAVPPETGVFVGKDLWVVQSNGSDARPLVQGLEVLEARWSPLENSIAYGTWDGNIHLLRSDGSGYRSLLDNHTGFLGTWSPDGSKIAFQRMPVPMDFWTLSLGILDVATGSVFLPVTEATYRADYRPYLWSVDGNQILFQSDRDGGLWWQVDLDRKELALVQTKGRDEFSTVSVGVSRSPLADQVVFWRAQSVDNVATIWVMNFDGSNLRELAKGGNATWSPDGKQVVYTGPTGGLWVVNLDGTGASQIADQDQDALWLWHEPYWCR